MKIIEQSHEILTYDDQLKLIEAAGRTCYKSEDKITDDSAARFVKMITKAGHFSVLEHASICFVISTGVPAQIKNMEHQKYLNITNEGSCLVSGNFRAWLEFFNRNHRQEGMATELIRIANYLHDHFPVVFPELFQPLSGTAPLVTEDAMSDEEKLVHATRSVRFITNRGVTHEMVRHRPWAYCQESTRYVKYLDDMEFIRPEWTTMGKLEKAAVEDPEWDFKMACHQAEQNYKNLLNKGLKAQDARGVLPNDLKTEIIATAPLREWKHMFSLRTTKAAHPQIRALMRPLWEQFKTESPEIF